MGILDKVRRHAWVASGNFASMFKNVELPTLPEATTRLIREVSSEDPDIHKIEQIISATPELSAKVIRVINSSLYSLPNQVTSVFHAMNMLGFAKIREISLGFAVANTLPEPKEGLFDHEAFWTDSLTRALLARSFTKQFRPGSEDEAFTSTLLADVAVPVLLSAWEDYYSPLVAQWTESPERLSRLERQAFNWDHAQAGAWILQSWGFPEEMVAYVGTHNLGPKALEECELDQTLAMPMALASLAPSILKPDMERAERLVKASRETLNMRQELLEKLLADARLDLDEMRDLFNISSERAFLGLDVLDQALQRCFQEVQP